MKQISIEKLNNYDLFFKNIYAIDYLPKVRNMKIVNRNYNGFLFVTEGEMRYTQFDQNLYLSRGSLIYLPRGSTHEYHVLSKTIRHIQIDFECFDSTSGENIIFSNKPEIMLSSTNSETENIIKELCKVFSTSPNDRLKINHLLFYLLQKIVKEKRKESFASHANVASKIQDYIPRHYTQNITTEALCQTFNISPTHIRREFKRHTGQTITDYVNSYRIKQSLYLIKNTDMSILNIALQVGYNSAEYYNRIFKKIMNISPIKYRKEYSNKS